MGHLGLGCLVKAKDNGGVDRGRKLQIGLAQPKSSTQPAFFFLPCAALSVISELLLALSVFRVLC